MLPLSNANLLRDAILNDRTQSSQGTTRAERSDNVFGNILHAASEQIQAADTKAQQAVVGLLSGQGIDVHEAMIATQQADLTFQLALQVRNKAVAAYQQMMQMQF